jgi:catechol 2,3-dioxygenase-like lactoylglutathione lyase family enzyme
MATKDMDATIRFWRDLLGMRLLFGLGKPGYRHYFIEISEKVYIAFFEWPDVEPVPEKDHGYPARGPFIFDHVSFGVEESDDLWNIKGRLDAAGFWVSEVIDHGFIHSIYSFDPNGIPIEFSWVTGGLDVRANPVMLDLEPSAVTLEGPDPVEGVWPLPGADEVEERAVYSGEGLDLFLEDRRNWWKKDSEHKEE